MSFINQQLRGIIPPLATPLLSQDELDVSGLERLIDFQIQNGVAGLFILGTTGEGPSLSYRLRYELVEKTCEITAGRVPILVGVTDTSLTEAIELSKFCGDVGVGAVVAAAPYYFSVGQDEVCDYLLSLADDSALPLFAYNIPPCVGICLTFESVSRLAGHTNICGIKDSAGDLPAYKKILELRNERPDWTFLIGPEHLTAESVMAGGDGGVNGGANLCPQLFVSIYEAATRRDQKEIDRLQSQIVKLSGLYQLLGQGASGYLRGLKSAMEAAGLCSGYPAAPFRPVDDTERSKIQDFVKTLEIKPTRNATSPV